MMSEKVIETFLYLLLTLSRPTDSNLWPWSNTNVTVSKDSCASLSLIIDSSMKLSCGSELLIIKSSVDDIGSIVKKEFGGCVENIENATFSLNISNSCQITPFEFSTLQTIRLNELIGRKCECYENKNGTEWVGLIFSPYDKHSTCDPTDFDQNGKCLPTAVTRSISWTEYSRNEIQKQLELVATQFKELSLYGIGTVCEAELTNYKNVTCNRDFREGVNISQVPLITAEINKNAGYHKLTLIIGAYFHETYPVNQAQQEVLNAIEATKLTNIVYNGSATGISLQFDPVNMINNEANISFAINSLEEMKRNFKPSSNVKVGIRFVECEHAFQERLSKPEETECLFVSGCPPKVQLHPNLINLVKQTQFLICFIHPLRKFLFAQKLNLLSNNLTAEKVTNYVTSKLKDIKIALLNVNPEIEIYLETGWPSYGSNMDQKNSKNFNTLRNMRDYWVEISKWAIETKTKVFLLEGLDEPWKEPGVCGSEGHYGLWSRKDNSESSEYEEKFIDVQNLTEADKLNNFLEIGKMPEYCPKESTDRNETEFLTPEGKVAAAVVLGISGVVVTLLISGLVYLGFRLRVAKKSETKLNQRYLEMFHKGTDTKKSSEDDYQTVALQFPYDKRKYELDKGAFKIDTSKSIGKGQSGTVYLGQINGRNDKIAFKTTNSSSTILDIKNLLSEIKILSYIGENENIICLIGAYTEKLEKGIVYVALEYCSLGSLDKFLQEKGKFISSDENDEPMNLNYVTAACFQSSDESLSSEKDEEVVEIPDASIYDYDFDQMVKWIYQIANGMEWLAALKVVHADLSCRNILLTSQKSIKITDFGLSQKLYADITVFESDIPLPFRWMSPESLRKLTFSTESDVWSYGVVIYEIFSNGIVPYSGISFSHQFITDLEEGVRLEDPPHATEPILDIMDCCWSICPTDRPSFTQIKLQIQKLLS